MKEDLRGKIIEDLKSRKSEEELREMMNKGIAATEMKKNTYWRMLEEELKGVVIEYTEKKKGLALKAYLLHPEGKKIMIADALDEMQAETRIEILKNIDFDIRYGEYAERILAASGGKVSEGNNK